MAIKNIKIAADFETTTDPNDCRVWAACAVDIDTLETLHLSNSIESFFEWLKDKNTVAYYQNLKFDGEFICSLLLKLGYKYSTTREPMTFSTLITDTGLWYSITVIFEKKNKKYKKVTFYDSLKKLPFKVSVIAKAFNLEDQKGEIDYKKYRPPGYVMTTDEEDYILKDCRIVAAALKIQFTKGLTKMTNASDAMSWFKNTLGDKNFERLFPVFPIDLDTNIRRSYKGGFVYLNPKYKNTRGLKGRTFDVNSLYPSVMYDCLLPYGYPIFFEGEPNPDEKYNLFICRIKARFKLKKDHIPTIQLKNSNRFIQTEYITDSDVYDKKGLLNNEPVELVLTSVDLALFLDHYKIDYIEYLDGFKFKGRTGFFKEYIDYWSHIKATTKGAEKQLAKLMLNSLYGRFALNPKSSTKFPVIDESGIVHLVANTKENRKIYDVDIKEDELRDPVYTAMGSFITAYARDKTIRSAQKVFDRFIYADTDSLHIKGYDDIDIIDIHPTRLGAWKDEGYFSDSMFIRAKTYMESIGAPVGATLKIYAKWTNHRNDQTLKDYCLYRWQYETDVTPKVTCAGMPDNVKEKVNYDNFIPGATFDGKLVPRRCVGGIVLKETTFTIVK